MINLGITSVVILGVFGIIYFAATESANRRPPIPQEMTFTTSASEAGTDVEKIVTYTIREEKAAAAQNLLITLVVAGVAIEIAVALVSYIMAEQAIKPVREAYESQKIFIANASHEIKTPLAAITANLEAADIHNNKWIRNVERETEKLSKLNSELLALARTDLANAVLAEEVDLATTARQTIESFEPRISRKQLSVKIDLPEKIKINSSDFIQILSILMDNAVKYCGKQVRVTINSHELVVMNDGAKISDQDLPRVFDRFYQVDKSAEGVGLGLAIAKSLADRNSWKLTARCDKMTNFTLNF
ncbi:HAMP domain-containing histidine kinase [Candidatus Saccharibacteria bacterium]|nr:HAMP domain-containing histidine kinase [Candidatus Saccharibacteria bacterium]